MLLSPTSDGDVDMAAQAAGEKTGKKLKAVHREVQAYVATHKGGDADRFLALAELRVEKACMLLTRYRAGEFRDQMVARELDQAGGIIDSLAAGQTPRLPATGLIEEAYYSDIDGSPQPYIYYIPKRKPAGKYGLFVFLHGYVGYLDKVNWIEFMYSDKLNTLAEELGVIPVLPFGRSNTEFMGVGEVDVLDAIAEMKKHYPIDAARVVLSGGSMGGSGAYTIACHYPQLFAGMAPIAGRYSYYVWKEIDRQRYVGFKRIQTDIDYAQALAQNLYNVPAFIFHGKQDYLVKPAQSRGMSKLLKSLGQSVEYKEFDQGDHWIWGDCFMYPPFMEWLRQRRAPAWPKRVKYKTYTLDFDRAYWVRVGRIQEWGRPAIVDAQVRGDGTVEAKTQNVGQLILTLGEGLVGPRDQVTVAVNGKAKEYELDDDRLVRITVLPRPESYTLKTHGSCGPARDAYCSKFLMVYGTQGGSTRDVRTALKAGREWIQFAKGRAAMKADDEVSDEDIAQSNLILFGDARSNSVVARIADKLPIQITPDEFVVGERRISRVDGSLLMIYPNPLNRKRYVLLNVGTFWGEYLSINHKLDHVPDFIVFRDSRDDDGNNKYICAGYFDEQWRLQEGLIWDEGQGNEGRAPVE